jgi:hypothetical protein
MENEKSLLDLIDQAKQDFKKPNTRYSQEVHQKVIDLLEDITNYDLTDYSKINLITLIEKFGLEQTLDGINSAKKYLEYTDLEQTKPTEESVDKFLVRYGGVVHNEGLSEIDQKIYFMMGIGRSRFGNWSYRKVQWIGKKLVEYLRERNHTDQQILDILDNEVIPDMHKSKNWTTWKFTLPNELF